MWSRVPPALSLQEGASYIPQSVNWYLQNSGGHIIHLFYIPSGTKKDGRLNATTVPKEGSSSLYISSSQTTDSGTYFCAVQHSAPQAPAASTQTLHGAQPLLQPQSRFEATTGHLQCLMLLTYISTVLIRHLLALQIMDFGLYLSFSTCISFCTGNF